MNKHARFDEIPSMTLKDIKERKRYGQTDGRTDGQRENSIPTHKHSLGGGIIITLSVGMETSGWIWPNLELIQAFMHVLIAYKYEKDQMKNSGENVMRSFSPL